MLSELLPLLTPRIAEFRRDIHAHPELAFDEHRTAGRVVDYLNELGLEVHRGLAGTGVVAKLSRGSSERAIGLRADMDALPLGELNSFSYRSQHAGKMHACGHDGHTAMLLGAADALSKVGRFDGTVYFIFQPAEEGEGGGRLMVEQGLFDQFPMEMVFGLHNWPGMAAGSFGVTEGPVMAGTDRFDITLTGLGGHAAMPHQAVDVVLAGSALVQALQSLVSRNTDPLDSAVVSVTRFHAGHADNVLPESAILGGTVRTLNTRLQDRLETGFRRVCRGIEITYGASIDLKYVRGYPPTINAPGPASIARDVASEVVRQLGERGRVHVDLPPSMGAEDFAYLALAKPACYVWLGNGLGADAIGDASAESGACMLHNPRYDFNDDIIGTGIRYWVGLVEKALGQAG